MQTQACRIAMLQFPDNLQYACLQNKGQNQAQLQSSVLSSIIRCQREWWFDETSVYVYKVLSFLSSTALSMHLRRTKTIIQPRLHRNGGAWFAALATWSGDLQPN
jgi:hypothetical protein